MKNVANLSRSEREELFIVTAREVRLPEAMVEKNFWGLLDLGLGTPNLLPHSNVTLGK